MADQTSFKFGESQLGEFVEAHFSATGELKITAGYSETSMPADQTERFFAWLERMLGARRLAIATGGDHLFHSTLAVYDNRPQR